MNIAINFNSATWTCSDALSYIFFSDRSEPVKNNISSADIQRYITAYSENKNCKMPRIYKDSPIEINRLIELLSNQSTPPLNNLSDAPLAWVKFAFFAMRNGIALSDHFIRQYARWRLTRVVTHGPETILNNIDSTKTEEQNKPILIARQKFLGDPIDLFLFSNKTPFRLGNGTVWKLSGANTSKSSQQKLALVKEATGTNLTNNVAYCLETAASNRLISGLHNKTFKGRFLCDLSRKELTKILMKRFKSRLRYSESSIFRTLSTFVACPGYRR